MIAVDAMGGDHAPEEVVEGAVLAASEVKRSIMLVGDLSKIDRLLPKPCPTRIELHPASQVIEMHEKPVEALRRKKDSSLVVAANLVRDGVAQAMVSAGNTGAATAASVLAWRQAPGVHRPAIASLMPNRGDGFVLLDAGASPDVDPEHLVEFGKLGRAYASTVMGRSNPKVHLLNIGEEDSKGNAFTKQAFGLLSQYDWFAGNIEGKDMFFKNCDVVVCDAFVGNIVLKTAEGVAEFFMELMREQVPSNPVAKIPFLPLRKLVSALKKKGDYAEVGGSPLLGLNGICVIAHGRSNARAIKNAIRLADRAIEGGLVTKIRESFEGDKG
ncbi:MAG: phosphate acyltransferase PlsX [Fimbriimonadaceae bacterium]